MRNSLLDQFTVDLPDEERARQVADEYELERELLAGDVALEKVLRRYHTGPSADRRLRLMRWLPATDNSPKNFTIAIRGDASSVHSIARWSTARLPRKPITSSTFARWRRHLLNMVFLCPNHHTVVHKTGAPSTTQG